MNRNRLLPILGIVLAAACSDPSIGKTSPPPRVSERDQALRVGGDVKAPVLISRAEPRIPPNTPCRSLVQFTAVIDEHGNVKEVHDITPQPDAFSRAYGGAIQNSKFRPGTLHGKPVPVQYAVTVAIRCR